LIRSTGFSNSAISESELLPAVLELEELNVEGKCSLGGDDGGVAALA
jgi:hypothetical protein